MNNSNQRILLGVTMRPSDNPIVDQKMKSIYQKLNNTLTGNRQLPNISEICRYCDTENEKLGAYIRNECFDLKKVSTIYFRDTKKINRITNIFDPADKKNIRIILYPGAGNDMDSFKNPESTHNMILRFADDIPNFCAADVHVSPPSFYQRCSSENTALLYLEALLVDACMCHYLGISDVASFHDEKIKISSEKVRFLKEFVKSKDIKNLDVGAQKLVTQAVSLLQEITPYVSFLSLFTIAKLDFTPNSTVLFFKDYCRLWKYFQVWYFKKHGRYFSTETEVDNPINTIFNRNKYQGQVSPSKIADKIKEIIKKPTSRNEEGLLGLESRYAVIVLKHKEREETKKAQLDALFVGQVHPATWDIVYWGDLWKYEDYSSELEIIPIIIDA